MCHYRPGACAGWANTTPPVFKSHPCGGAPPCLCRCFHCRGTALPLPRMSCLAPISFGGLKLPQCLVLLALLAGALPVARPGADCNPAPLEAISVKPVATRRKRGAGGYFPRPGGLLAPPRVGLALEPPGLLGQLGPGRLLFGCQTRLRGPITLRAGATSALRAAMRRQSTAVTASTHLGESCEHSRRLIESVPAIEIRERGLTKLRWMRSMDGWRRRRRRMGANWEARCAYALDAGCQVTERGWSNPIICVAGSSPSV